MAVAPAEKQVLCFIYSDVKWNGTTTDKVRRCIANFKTARKEGRLVEARTHLRDALPECARLKKLGELPTIIDFPSYKGDRAERHDTEKLLDNLKLNDFDYVAVYTMPQMPRGLRILHRHCTLTLAVWESL